MGIDPAVDADGFMVHNHLVMWPMDNSLDVNLLLVFVGGLRQNLTTPRKRFSEQKLRQNFDRGRLMRAQTLAQTQQNTCLGPQGIVLESFGFEAPGTCRSLIKVSWIFGQGVVQCVQQIQA